MFIEKRLILKSRIFCGLVGLLALLGAGYLFLIPKGLGTRAIFGIQARILFAGLFSSILIVLSIGFGVLAYLFWRNPAKIQKHLFGLQNRMRPFPVFVFLALVVYLSLEIFFYHAYLPISPVFFVYLQPVLIWLGGFAALAILLLVFKKLNFYFIAEVMALMLNVTIIRSVQTFLFPLETYWQTIVFGLFFYSLLEAIMVQTGKLKNFLFALDKHSLGWKDALWLLSLPVIMSLAIQMSGKMDFVFLVPILFLVCGLQTCLANFFHRVSKYIWYFGNSFFVRANLFWGLSVLVILGFYYLAANLFGSYPSHNPLLEYTSAAKGTWYVVPVKDSDLFPLGYARFEDSVGDDLGHYFFALLGSRFGFVQACQPPFLNFEKAVPVSITPTFQPVFNYTFDALCLEWAQTLPSFYWRIGLFGILLTAFIFGFFILRDPFAFLLIALISLTAWLGWPASKPGQVESLIFGVPFIALIPYVVRHSKQSTLFVLCLICGALAGLAGFVRSPSGSALSFAGVLAIVVFTGVRNKNWLLTIAVILALLIGQQLISLMLDGLLMYRDERLLISAPLISIAAHAPGWNILGGIGGAYTGDIKPSYPNALDMVHWDAILLLVIYNENSLSMFALRHMWAGPRVASHLFLQYILSNPVEFSLTTLQKAYQAWNSLFSIPTNWSQVTYLSVLLGGFVALVKNHFISKQDFSDNVKVDFFESLSVILGLALVSSGPAILTVPTYFQALYPAAAVLFLAVILVLVYFILSLVNTAFSQVKI